MWMKPGETFEIEGTKLSMMAKVVNITDGMPLRFYRKDLTLFQRWQVASKYELYKIGED